MAFSSDGHTLASGNSDGTVALWNVADPAHPRLLGQSLSADSGNAVYVVAFSPDGHIPASGSIDDITRLWNLNVQHAMERICATARRNHPQQWYDYIPQRPQADDGAHATAEGPGRTDQ